MSGARIIPKSETSNLLETTFVALVNQVDEWKKAEVKSAELSRAAVSFADASKRLHTLAAIKNNKWEPIEEEINAAKKDYLAAKNEASLQTFKNSIEIGICYLAYKVCNKLNTKQKNDLQSEDSLEKVVAILPESDVIKYRVRVNFLKQCSEAIMASQQKKLEPEVKKIKIKKKKKDKDKKQKLETEEKKEKTEEEAAESSPLTVLRIIEVKQSKKSKDPKEAKDQAIDVPTESIPTPLASPKSNKSCWASLWYCCSFDEEEQKEPSHSESLNASLLSKGPY